MLQQLSILIEMMRREGFEMQVSRPEIVTKDVDGAIDNNQRLLLGSPT